MGTTNKEKGIVVYVNANDMVYYITNSRETIYTQWHANDVVDDICKDIIVRTAKQYTIRGYNQICNKLYLEKGAKATSWISIDRFIKDLKPFQDLI